jgi:iron complex outermembrane receptor protein
VRNRFHLQAFNYVGTGNVQGTAVTPGRPEPDRPEHPARRKIVELSVQDAIRWNDRSPPGWACATPA